MRKARTAPEPSIIGGKPAPNKSKLKLLSIGAHPADVFDQSGGTMAHHAARGDWVGCCVLTHGARVHDKVISDNMFLAKEVPEDRELERLMAERGEVKAGEVRDACAILGVKHIYFFGADDDVLLPTRETIKRLASLIREIRPDIILTHFPYEEGGIWGAHASAGHIVMYAKELAQAVDMGDRNPPHRVTQVFYWGGGAGGVPVNVWDARRAHYNDVFIDITDVVEKKLAALDQLASQGYGGAYARKRIEVSDGAFGRGGCVAYAEPFISYRASTHYYLPVSDYDREVSALSDHQLLTRYSYKIKTD